MPKRLVHVIPDESALVLGEFLRQADITFHAPQAVAHIVHVFAENKRLGGVGLQVRPDIPGLFVHAAFHIADNVKFPVMEYAFVMDQPPGVLFVEEVAHGQNVLTGITLVAAGPDEHRRMVFVPFKHIAGPVHHAVFPLRFAARHVPLRVDPVQPLPAAVAFQVGFIDHINAVAVTQIIPQALVGIMAGAHSVDVVAQEHLHGGIHILRTDGAAFFGVPFVAVDAVKDNALPVQAHDAVDHLEPAEADVIGHHFLQIAFCVGQCQHRMVQGGRFMAPGLYSLQFQCIAVHRAVIQGIAFTVGQTQMHGGTGGFPFQFQPGRQGAGDVVRFQPRLQPEVGQMHLGFGVQEYRPENTREPEEVLVLDPGSTAPLVHFHAQAVDTIPQAGGQVKVRRGKAVLGIANKLPVAPQVHGLLHTLEADTDVLPAQTFVQGKFSHIAPHRGVVPVDLGRVQGGVAVPRIDGIGVLQFPVALQLDMPRHPDRTESGEVCPLPPELRGTGGGAGAVGKLPFPIQTLAQAAAPVFRFFLRTVAHMVGMGIQPVDGKNRGVSQPAKFRFTVVHTQGSLHDLRLQPANSVLLILRAGGLPPAAAQQMCGRFGTAICVKMPFRLPSARNDLPDFSRLYLLACI